MMKILYFGTVCDLKAYNQRLEGCLSKPSVAPILFETALLEGFSKNGVEVQIHSFPMIPTFPASRMLHFGKDIETLPCGYTCRWLNTVNLPVFKQISRCIDAGKILKHWLSENAEDGIIITYSIPPFLVKEIMKYAKRFHVKTAAIVPDLLRDMYINEKRSVITAIKKQYLAPALKLQGEYDAYIFLTDAMHEVVAPEKPYIVMEGIADTSSVRAPETCEKAKPRAIMYAGMLHEKYGIVNLLDAFENFKENELELWLFGDGTAVPEIRKRAENDRRIRYFGTMSHEEILLYERKASLLVNPRDPEEEFTQYSFPSKTIEYMLSGTPLVTTKLKGIPTEYFDYVFPAESNRPEALTDIFKKVLAYSDEEIRIMGRQAQQFISEKKNSRSQSARILNFLKEVM